MLFTIERLHVNPRQSIVTAHLMTKFDALRMARMEVFASNPTDANRAAWERASLHCRRAAIVWGTYTGTMTLEAYRDYIARTGKSYQAMYAERQTELARRPVMTLA